MVTKSTTAGASLGVGDVVTYTIDYAHLSGDTITDVVVYDVPGTGLVIDSSSVPYTIQTVGQ
ncbi:MAG: hypothetical protein H6766_01660 [Candidatus Peribacteria bacterium]|nr:MAG: hypothetical protein H6766_01660 [Candidatus Peribacteria bacterium]